MSDNSPLHLARRQKRDEFYTQLSDIENELRHYKEHFQGKVVYCNCDDPYESNFFKYFAANFHALGLKKLIATGYADSPIQGEQLALDEIKGLKKNGVRPYRTDIIQVRDFDGDGAVGLSDVEYLLRNYSSAADFLAGSGDFRSEESIGLLKQADIVVTNPPFSMFREYVAQLMEHGKHFLILADQNAVTYKEIFNYIREDRLWLGNDNGGTKWFRVPEDYDIKTESRKKYENGIKYISMGRIGWYTNLDIAKRHEDILLFKKYDPEEYPKYDGYDIINVDRVADIPVDYEGVMGVPITFLDKYNPAQFEILGIANSARWIGYECYTLIRGKKIYNRLLIRRR